MIMIGWMRWQLSPWGRWCRWGWSAACPARGRRRGWRCRRPRWSSRSPPRPSPAPAQRSSAACPRRYLTIEIFYGDSKYSLKRFRYSLSPSATETIWLMDTWLDQMGEFQKIKENSNTFPKPPTKSFLSIMNLSENVCKFQGKYNTREARKVVFLSCIRRHTRPKLEMDLYF